MPAQDSGIGEKQQTHRHKNDSDGTEALEKCLLGQSRAVLSTVDDASGQNGEYGQVQDNKGIDKYADHGAESLVMGRLRLGPSVGVGSGAHSRLIGEQPSGYAIADSLPNRDACSRAHYR